MCEITLNFPTRWGISGERARLGYMRDAVFPVLLFLGGLALVTIVVPRVNARRRDPRSGWDRLFDSGLGRLYLAVLLVALLVSVVIAATLE